MWHREQRGEALRRGIATLANAVEKDAMAAKGLLRRASVTTTQKHYIKEVPEITQKAMEKVETLCTNRATMEASKPNYGLESVGAGGGNRTHGLGIMRPSLCH